MTPDTSGERVRVFTIVSEMIPEIMDEVWYAPTVEPMTHIEGSRRDLAESERMFYSVGVEWYSHDRRWGVSFEWLNGDPPSEEEIRRRLTVRVHQALTQWKELHGER